MTADFKQHDSNRANRVDSNRVDSSKINYNRKDSNKADSDSGDSNKPRYDIIVKELMVTEL